MSAKLDLKWMKDLATKERRQSSADHQFLRSNGGYKLFDMLLKVLGNGYKGKDGWHNAK